MAYSAMEADKMLDVYIQDYLVKKKYNNSAKAFQAEAQLPTKPSAIDAPGSFLFEWWSVFWDVFIDRYKRTGPNNEVLIMKAKEQLQQQHRQLNPEQQWLQQLQLRLFLQQQGQHLQQQYHGDETRLQHGTIRNNLAKQSTAAQKMSKEDLSLRSRDVLSDAEIKKFMQPKYSENAVHLSKPSHASILRSAGGGDLPPELLKHNPPVGNSKSLDGMEVQKQLSLAPEDLRNSMTPPLNPRVAGSNLAVNTSPLKGWPLVGLDRLQPGLSHQKKSFPHPYPPSPLQLHQQIRAVLNGQNVDMEKIGTDTCQWNFMENDAPSIVPVQVGLPISAHGESWMPASKDQTSKKRKQPMPSGGPANSSETNGNAPTQISSPSSPSTHATTGVISLPALPREDNSSKADLDNAVNKGSAEDDVDSFLSNDKPEAEPTATVLLDTIQEIVTICANKVKCCELSFDGKVIATGGEDKKAVLWCTESGLQKYVFEHDGTVTDLCFGPRMPRLATSSADKTVKIWNVEEPGCPFRTFVGHSASVLSVDIHPKKDDLVCSCDDASSIRYWSIKNGGCTGMLTGSATQVRFEPTCGRYLAASFGNGLSIIDVETMQTYRYPLKGHATDVLSICWNSTGEYLASMSEDSIRVWKIGSWGLENCVHELSISDKKIRCCVFHPCYSSLLVVGFNESLELWHMAENKVMSALRQPTFSLAVSKPAGLVASVCDGNLIKLWK